ncbi:hypothetical protein MHYP_G00213710 [Metynnis hypsauchen]
MTTLTPTERDLSETISRVERIEWPASSPDLNLIEHLRNQLGRAVRTRATNTTTLADMPSHSRLEERDRAHPPIYTSYSRRTSGRRSLKDLRAKAASAERAVVSAHQRRFLGFVPGDSQVSSLAKISSVRSPALLKNWPFGQVPMRTLPPSGR